MAATETRPLTTDSSRGEEQADAALDKILKEDDEDEDNLSDYIKSAVRITALRSALHRHMAGMPAFSAVGFGCT